MRWIIISLVQIGWFVGGVELNFNTHKHTHSNSSGMSRYLSMYSSRCPRTYTRSAAGRFTCGFCCVVCVCFCGIICVLGAAFLCVCFAPLPRFLRNFCVRPFRECTLVQLSSSISHTIMLYNAYMCFVLCSPLQASSVRCATSSCCPTTSSVT